MRARNSQAVFAARYAAHFAVAMAGAVLAGADSFLLGHLSGLTLLGMVLVVAGAAGLARVDADRASAGGVDVIVLLAGGPQVMGLAGRTAPVVSESEGMAA